MNQRKAEAVAEHLREMGHDAEVQQVVKNGVVKTGIIIKEGVEGIATVLYIKPDYTDAEVEARRLLSIYNNAEKPNVSIEDFTDLAKIADGLRVGFQRLSEESIVKKETRFEGIEAYLYCNIDLGFGGKGNFKVTPHYLEANCIDEEDAWNLAKLNTSLELEIKTMPEVLAEMMNDPEMAHLLATYSPTILYILSNKSHYKGAACMSDNALRDIAKRLDTKDLIAIPASIHEWIVVADNKLVTVEEVTQMVKDINLAEVQPEDWLGDRAYKIHIGKEVSIG